MNENLENLSLNDHTEPCQGGDPCPPEGEKATAEAIPSDDGGYADGTPAIHPQDERTLAPDEEDLPEKDLLSDDPETDPASDLSETDASVDLPDRDSDELNGLRREVDRLRTLLSDRNLDHARREVEHGEFSTLYPNVRFEDLPDDVLLDVGRGLPVTAAYALSERRRVLREEAASRSNRDNRARSAGALGRAETDLFSPEEVRAMSAAEVRANLEKIRRSMQSWT